jgi:hypothetical protein
MIRLPFTLIGILVQRCWLAWPLRPRRRRERKIKSVEADKGQFTMTDVNNKNWTITLGTNAKVFLNDKEAKLADLQADDEVAIKYEKDGEKFIASEVRCKRKQ